VRIPGIDHPITIEPSSERVTVRAGGRVIAETTSALVLREAKLPAVFYIPLADVDHSVLARSENHTYCPYKGKASYYDVVVDGDTISDAIWTYEQPYDAVAQIEGHVAFYPSLVEIATAA
jgi:uncharacterized protein (DUF427 family)